MSPETPIDPRAKLPAKHGPSYDPGEPYLSGVVVRSDVNAGLCVVSTCGVLKARHTSRSDCDRELGEGDRHSPVHWLLGGQLVVASPKILDEAMPSNDHPGTAVLLEPLLGRSHAFSWP